MVLLPALLGPAGASERCSFHGVTVVPLDGGSGSGGLTADDVRAHVEEKVEWVDPQKQPWSCVDGRATQPGLTTPAGDSGEFILGLVAYEERLLAVMPRAGHLTEHDVTALFEDFVSTIPYSRRFYMHTDEHAVERLREATGDDGFDPARRPAREDQARLLELLADPAYLGCGHLRLLIQHPDQYRVRPQLTQWFIKAFFDFMWNHEHGGKLHHHTSIALVELEGNHVEQAVVVIDTDKSHLAPGDVCMGLAPMIPGIDDLNSFFTDHASFVSLGIRGEVARFFAVKLDEQSIGISDATPILTPGKAPHADKNYAQLLARMTELGNIQLGLTVGYLAKGEPQYAVNIVVDRERKMGMIIGSLVSIAAWVVALAAMILFGRRALREEERNAHSLV